MVNIFLLRRDEAIKNDLEMKLGSIWLNKQNCIRFHTKSYEIMRNHSSTQRGLVMIPVPVLSSTWIFTFLQGSFQRRTTVFLHQNHYNPIRDLTYQI